MSPFLLYAGCTIHYRPLPSPAAVMDDLAGVPLHEDHVCPSLESFLGALTSERPEIDVCDVPCECARAACEHCGALVARCSLNDHAQVGDLSLSSGLRFFARVV